MVDEVTFKWRFDKHEWRLIAGDWELHYLPHDNGVLLRYASEAETKYLNEIKRLTDIISNNSKTNS